MLRRLGCWSCRCASLEGSRLEFLVRVKCCCGLFITQQTDNRNALCSSPIVLGCCCVIKLPQASRTGNAANGS